MPLRAEPAEENERIAFSLCNVSGERSAMVMGRTSVFKGCVRAPKVRRDRTSLACGAREYWEIALFPRGNLVWCFVITNIAPETWSGPGSADRMSSFQPVVPPWGAPHCLGTAGL